MPSECVRAPHEHLGGAAQLLNVHNRGASLELRLRTAQAKPRTAQLHMTQSTLQLEPVWWWSGRRAGRAAVARARVSCHGRRRPRRLLFRIACLVHRVSCARRCLVRPWRGWVGAEGRWRQLHLRRASKLTHVPRGPRTRRAREHDAHRMMLGRRDAKLRVCVRLARAPRHTAEEGEDAFAAVWRVRESLGKGPLARGEVGSGAEEAEQVKPVDQPALWRQRSAGDAPAVGGLYAEGHLREL